MCEVVDGTLWIGNSETPLRFWEYCSDPGAGPWGASKMETKREESYYMRTLFRQERCQEIQRNFKTSFHRAAHSKFTVVRLVQFSLFFVILHNIRMIDFKIPAFLFPTICPGTIQCPLPGRWPIWSRRWRLNAKGVLSCRKTCHQHLKHWLSLNGTTVMFGNLLGWLNYMHTWGGLQP